MYAGQKSERAGIQDFLCPFTDMYIAQGSGGSYSHKGTMANDVRGAEAGVRYPYYAPCDVECIWTFPSFGEAMWRSTTKVRFANGNIDYATFMTAHDDSFDATVGQIVPQGTQLGNMGTKSPKGEFCYLPEEWRCIDGEWFRHGALTCFYSYKDLDYFELYLVELIENNLDLFKRIRQHSKK